MQDLWLAFMRDPVKGLPEQGWPAYVPGAGGKAMEFAWEGLVTQLIPVEEFEDNCVNGTAVGAAGAVPVDSNNFGVV